MTILVILAALFFFVVMLIGFVSFFGSLVMAAYDAIFGDRRDGDGVVYVRITATSADDDETPARTTVAHHTRPIRPAGFEALSQAERQARRARWEAMTMAEQVEAVRVRRKLIDNYLVNYHPELSERERSKEVERIYSERMQEGYYE